MTDFHLQQNSAPATPDVERDALTKIDAIAVCVGVVDPRLYKGMLANIADIARTALSAPAVSTGGEPVAWMFWNEPDTQRHFAQDREAIGNYWTKIAPLYAAPPASGDVRAAVIEALVAALEPIAASPRGLEITIEQLDACRAALSQAPATDAAASDKSWNIFDTAMMMLEDVPGETMLERIAKLKEWYLQLQKLAVSA